MKKYSLSYWVKQRLHYGGSQPEQHFQAALDLFVNDREHCPFEFAGSPIELTNVMYQEWKKRGSVHWCFFPTPLPVARDLAILLGVNSGDVVFDPGAGFGNLLHAAEERGATAFGCEFQHWLPGVGKTLGLNVQRGDFLDGYQPAAFTCVLTNPPFGRLGESADATADFLDRLADVCTDETRIAAILPRGFMQSERPKARVETIKKFRVSHSEPLPAETFKPLTNCATEMVLLKLSGGKPVLTIAAPAVMRPAARLCVTALNPEAWSEL